MAPTTIMAGLQDLLFPAELAALTGLLLAASMPQHICSLFNGVGGRAPASRVRVVGTATRNGYACAILCVYSWSLVGVHKTKFSGDAAPTPTNHPFLAGLAHLSQGGDVDQPWLKKNTSALCSARTDLHGDARVALAIHVLNPLLTATFADVDALVGVDDFHDLIRHCRDAVNSLTASGQPNKAIMTALFTRVMKHVNGRDGRHDLGDLFGRELLHKDFLMEVVRPLALHALADVEHTIIVEGMGAPETPLCLALRKVASWHKLVNGGFITRSAKAFQDTLWYHLFKFATDSRRRAHPMAAMKDRSFDQHFNSAPFLLPPTTASNAGATGQVGNGGGQLVVPETQ